MSLEETLTTAVFDRFRDLLYTRAGIALTPTKRSLVLSRLARRARSMGCRTFQEYYDAVVREPDGDEFLHMLDCMTTNKTDFFREPRHFLYLRETILPGLPPRSPIRIWSSACSSGEEPYSIAMTVCDALGSSPRDWRILASDISTRMLTQARDAVYDAERIKGLDTDLIHRHFLRGTGADRGRVRIKPHLTAQIVFRRINLMDQHYPIRSSLDVIFCRNVMIYFDRPTQEQVLRKFARYLKVGGYLFVGHSESLQALKHPFHYVEPTIYRKGAA